MKLLLTHTILFLTFFLTCRYRLQMSQFQMFVTFYLDMKGIEMNLSLGIATQKME